MFFKSKAKKQSEAEAAKASILDGFQRQLKEAEQCADPADRFLKLEECKDSIDEFVSVTKQQIRAVASGKFKTSYFGIVGGTSAGAGILILGLHFPPALILLIYPAIFGGTVAGRKAVQNSEARLLAEAGPFFDKLEAQKERAVAAADLILKNDLNALATSPRFEELVKKAPRVRDHFTAAYARRVALDEQRSPPPPAPPRPPGNGGLQL